MPISYTQKLQKHPNITTNCTKKCKICVFLRSIWNFSPDSFFFTQAPPVVPVTNMRYAPVFISSRNSEELREECLKLKPCQMS